MTRVLLSLIILSALASAQNPGLYDTATIRSLHLSFAQNDWWQQLQSNRSAKTDIEADLLVDGQIYPRIGVRFRGSSSYYATGSSQKKSFNLSIDSFVPGQDLFGYDSINLSNAFNDPTFVREVISYEILRQYLPAPKANWVKLVINGESWGLYVNVQQPDKDMMREWFDDEEGNRYRCDPPNSSGRGNSALQWLGSTVASYQAAYDLKTKANPTPWTDLMTVCDLLNNRTLAQLPTSLPAVFNVDRALWYLACNIVMVNLDSYVGRGNDYYLYFDSEHSTLDMMPWDMNESFGGYDANLSVSARETLSPFWNESKSTYARSFLPELAEHAPQSFRVRWATRPSSLRINELLAKNETGLQDSAGENDDWVELHNVGSTSVNVGGMYLTDRQWNPTKWQIPAGQQIGAGQSILIWCDEDGATQGPLHASFKLAASGESVILFDTDGVTLLDSIVFGPQVADVSTGRRADGGAEWVTFLDPSPLVSNAIQGCGDLRYSALDSTSQAIGLSLIGTAKLGSQVTFQMRHGPGSTLHFLMLGLSPSDLLLPLSSSQLLIALPAYELGTITSLPDGSAGYPFTIPLLPSLAGQSLFFQVMAVQGGLILASNGLELKFCP